jgi:hypothetical protein
MIERQRVHNLAKLPVDIGGEIPTHVEAKSCYKRGLLISKRLPPLTLAETDIAVPLTMELHDWH